MVTPHPGLADAPLLRGGSRAAARRACRCGSCARPAGRCPSTGPSAARAASSTPSASPSWPPRSPCSRCAATASTPPSSTATSSCRPPPSASASTSPRASGRSSSEPFRSAADLDRLRPFEPEVDTPYVARDRAASWSPSSAPRRSSASPARRSRWPATSSRAARRAPTGCTKALMHGEPDAVARAARPPGRHGHRVAARPGRGRRQRHPAVRLAGPARWRPTYYRALVLPASAQGVRRRSADLGVPRIHFGVGTGELLGADGRGRRRRGRRRLAGAARRRPRRACPARRCRATSTRPCAWRRGTSWPTARRDVLRRNGGRPGHVFNLGHGVLPEPDPGVLAAGRRARARGGPHRRWLSAARRGRDGLRHAGVARRRRGVLHPHPPRARRPTAEQLADLARRYDAIGGISPLAERTEAQRAGLAARPRRARARPVPRRARARSTPRRSSRTPSPTLADDGVDAHRRPRARAALLAALGRRSTRTASPRPAARRGVRVRGDRQLAPRAGLPRLPRRAPCATGSAALPERTKVLFTAHSLPERVLVDDPYPDQLRESAAAVAEAVGLDRWAGWSLALAVRRAARPSRGAAPTSSR